MTIDYDTIRAAVQALRPDDQASLHLANFVPRFEAWLAERIAEDGS